jgi:molybdenum cofactor cytidylyltransferase
MGQPKMLLPWGTTSVLGHLIQQWQRFDPHQIAVACAEGDGPLQAELNQLGFPAGNRIVNASPEQGMFSSVQCAARWSGWKPGLTHWAIVLGDQPHLHEQTLAGLLKFASEHFQNVCQPFYGGHKRHPVLLPAHVFWELSSTAAPNLKEFLRARPDDLALFQSDDPGLQLDIDRPEDYKEALGIAFEGRSQKL